jgi:mono/diheme cytochrome c family protein
MRSYTPAVTFVALILTIACAQQTPPPVPAAPPASAETPVQRGQYLVAAMGCHDCHTPWVVGPNGPGPDMTRALSGHPEAMKLGPAPKIDPATGWQWGGAATNTAFFGPWGVSYSANLTSDQNTGLGIWTEDMFVRAIREGKHMGTSRPILPPMPWPMYRNLNDADLKAIFAYLKTVPAIVNHVPEPMIAEAPGGGL